MKKTLLFMTFAFGLSYTAFAATCDVDSLADYIADGSCTIGPNLTFSGFAYTPSGDLPVSAAAITVNPEVIGGETGFTFSAPWIIPNGASLDSKIVYTAACAGCSIDDWVLTIAGAGSTGNGLINVAETSPQVSQGLALSSVGGVITMGPTCGAVPDTCSGTFPPVGSLTVTKDLAMNGGSTPNTTTAISSLTNLFSTTNNSTVPEPSLLILCTGMLALLPVARRRLGL
jgi:hypothetical protein